MHDVPDWSHTTQLDATPTSARLARAFVEHHLVDHRLAHLAGPVALVASELATNALVHAQTAFTVTLAADSDDVVLTVRDNSASPPTRSTTRVLDESGRGLRIVDMLTTEWGSNRDGQGAKSVWARFALSQWISSPP